MPANIRIIFQSTAPIILPSGKIPNRINIPAAISAIYGRFSGSANQNIYMTINNAKASIIISSEQVSEL